MYGIDQKVTRDYGTRCLIARRLVERGVRFVQILCNGQVWDHHGSIKTALPQRCVEVDKPAAALVRDLKERGLLDSTIVHWGGEMGRLPVIQFREGLTKRDKVGRDHNTYGFSQWVAGGGFRRGYIHGQTDEFSHYAVDGIIHHYDWLATILHQFGLDHKKLTALARATSDWSKTTRPAWPPSCSPDRSGAWPSVILRLIFLATNRRTYIGNVAMKFLNTFLLFAVGLALGQAQPADREALWKEVAEAEKKGRPKTAAAKLQTIYDSALKAGKHAEAIKVS